MQKKIVVMLLLISFFCSSFLFAGKNSDNAYENNNIHNEQINFNNNYDNNQSTQLFSNIIDLDEIEDEQNSLLNNNSNFQRVNSSPLYENENNSSSNNDTGDPFEDFFMSCLNDDIKFSDFKSSKFNSEFSENFFDFSSNAQNDNQNKPILISSGNSQFHFNQPVVLPSFANTELPFSINNDNASVSNLRPISSLDSTIKLENTINWNRPLFKKNKNQKKHSFNMSASNFQPLRPFLITQLPEQYTFINHSFPQTTKSIIHNKKNKSASHIRSIQSHNDLIKENYQKTALANSLNLMLQNLKQQDGGTERLVNYFSHNSKKHSYDQEEQEKIQLAANINAIMCPSEEEAYITHFNNNSKEHINEKKDEDNFTSIVNNLIDISDPFSFLAQQPRKKRKIDDVDLEEHLRNCIVNRHNLEAKIILTDEEQYEQFCKLFPFPITSCQEKAIAEINQEFESGKPMNHILIGSVGFGKTEVALRTAYKVAKTGQQVVIVAPTQLLAEQHFKTFSERFKEADLNVVYVAGGHKKKLMLENISSGEASIIIGTHAVFSDKIKYKSIGYIIIDEEQRFGVKQKEKLHQYFTNAHILWMSATPIPRTLELVRQNLMTSSTLKTPPLGRLDIITGYVSFVEEDIRSVIDLELNRQGQIFIVVSKINQIQEVVEFLQEIYPDEVIGIAHGKLKKDVLKKQLDKFRDKKFNILISTTVIEVGIDIPNANTMIIYGSKAFGVSALSQLRGRIGRSTIQAYCYIGLDPNESIENSNSISRLDAFVKNSKLGDDIKLSEVDLEIRGAGELFDGTQKGKRGKWENVNIKSKTDKEEIATLENNEEIIIEENENLEVTEESDEDELKIIEE